MHNDLGRIHSRIIYVELITVVDTINLNGEGKVLCDLISHTIQNQC